MSALGVADLMNQAVDQTGLHDFGDPWFREPLQLLVQSLRTEADLSSFGLRRAVDLVTSKLGVRLRVVDAHNRYPEIGKERIEGPIFIIGLPRTGSTLTHHLFGEDHRLRVPRRWETHEPWPPPESATYFTDPRIDRVSASMAPLYRRRPQLAAMHPTRGDFPEECVHMLSPSFAASLFFVLFGTQRYARGMLGCNVEAAYQFHKRFLQLLQWRCRANPWVLKYPGHLGHLDALRRVYPDARFVWLHRDPVEAITSITHLSSMAQTAHRRHSEHRAIAAWLTEEWAHRTRVAMAQRAHLHNAQIWYDLRYEDLVADPVSCVSGIYRWAGLDLPPTTACHMGQYVADPPYPRGGYSHDRRRLGVDEDRVRREFSEYVATYLAPRPLSPQSERARRRIRSRSQGANPQE